MRPSDEHLAESVRAAFEALPGPDATRLKELEVRLGHQAARPAREKKSRIGYWWLIAALAASGAAAWWAGEYFNATSREQETNSRAPVMRAADKPEQDGTSKAPQEYGNDSSKVGPAQRAQDQSGIYRRERY